MIIGSSSQEKKEEFLMINRLLFGKLEASSAFSEDDDESPSSSSSSSSGWPLRVNRIIQKDADGEEEDGDEDNEGGGGGIADDVCEELMLLSVRDDGGVSLLEFAGVHTRLIYDSDGVLRGEEKVGVLPVSPVVLRFNDAEEEEE